LTSVKRAMGRKKEAHPKPTSWEKKKLSFRGKAGSEKACFSGGKEKNPLYLRNGLKPRGECAASFQQHRRTKKHWLFAGGKEKCRAGKNIGRVFPLTGGKRMPPSLRTEFGKGAAIVYSPAKRKGKEKLSFLHLTADP